MPKPTNRVNGLFEAIHSTTDTGWRMTKMKTAAKLTDIGRQWTNDAARMTQPANAAHGLGRRQIALLPTAGFAPNRTF
jgi:hypothetical protein